MTTQSNPDTMSACPHCANTCNHTPAGHPTGYAVWECQRCGAFSTLEQLRGAEQRVNGRELETENPNQGDTMNTYYACCNANGPISVLIQASSTDDAIAIFAELDPRGMIDAAECYAENDLGIDGAGMTEEEFASAMEDAGFRVVRELDPVHSHQSGTAANLAGGWQLFGAKAAAY